jgi:hypothetical protein
MKFGTLAGNSSINSLIYASFEEIYLEDVAVFVRKFKFEKGMQLFHTLHELTVGAELCRRGQPARYERSVGGKTPDWSIEDEAGRVVEIFDVVALHQRQGTETDMLKTVSEGQIWSGWVSIPPDHIYSKIEQKAGPYSGLVDRLQIPYVIGLFGEFTASVDPEEVHDVLFEHHGGLFQQLPSVSALLYAYEENGIHHYTLFANPHARYQSRAVAAAFLVAEAAY